MVYNTYVPFKGNSLSGLIEIPKNAKLEQKDQYLYYFDKKVCSITSETAWEHFYEYTLEGEKRHKMIMRLYDFVLEGNEIEYPDYWIQQNQNHYWKNLIRTMPRDLLTQIYNKYIGVENCV